jgi:hypothetical protein
MENYKKIGKSSHAKHLRKKKGKWTKTMANGKSRSKSKLDLKKSDKDIVQSSIKKIEVTIIASAEEAKRKEWSNFESTPKEKAYYIRNEFDKTEWKW